jgi:phosphatidate cytidylyltransferase
MANWVKWRERIWAILPVTWQEILLNNFIQRCIAGVMLTLLSLWIVWGLPQLFPLYAWGVVLLAMREWQRMAEPDDWQRTVHYLYSSAMLLAIVQGLFGTVAAAVLVISLPLFLWLVACFIQLKRPLWFACSIIYMGLPALALISMISHYTIGSAVITYFFTVIWATDIAAYFIGRRLGGVLLAPDVSPKKTWSGFLGGLGAGTIMGILIGLFLGADQFVWLVVMSLLLSAAAQMSDLAESAIKRFYNVKDTGTMIMGHGGILDRIDSLMLSAPFFVLVQLLAGRPLPW